jgi:chemotaxis protein methyltransferase CheR
MTTLGDLAARLKLAGAAALEEAVVEAMTTNESFFFRDKTPFEAFTTVMLPSLVERRPPGHALRIWCAAASTGQEPYSLAMILKENARKLGGRRVEILATDLSNDVLERARAGIYSQFEVQRGLPIQLLVKYFAQAGEGWQISADVRGMVDYRRLNLLNPFVGLGTFDVVFCRNVLIYFDMPTKTDVLARMSKVVAPDGYLVLGAAETVVGLTTAFRPVAEHRGLYAVGAPALAATR